LSVVASTMPSLASDQFYSGFDDWMKPFPEQDRKSYPEIFELPQGVYEVTLARPLGIIFEEIDVGRGLYVQDLVEDGNAQLSGKIRGATSSWG
jgi:hypothetical protein